MLFSKYREKKNKNLGKSRLSRSQVIFHLKFQIMNAEHKVVPIDHSTISDHIRMQYSRVQLNSCTSVVYKNTRRSSDIHMFHIALL